MRKPIVSVTAADCRWVYYNGTGKGGTNRNKTQACVRCFHDPSKSMGKSEDERSQPQNKKLAFKRMAATESFQKWIKIETMKKTGEMDEIERKVDQEMKSIKVEMRDEKGRWTSCSCDTDYCPVHGSTP